MSEFHYGSSRAIISTKKSSKASMDGRGYSFEGDANWPVFCAVIGLLWWWRAVVNELLCSAAASLVVSMSQETEQP